MRPWQDRRSPGARGPYQRWLRGTLPGPAGAHRVSLANVVLGSSGRSIAGADEDKGDDVGVITKEEYVCDYCNKTITSADILIGKLALRKRGARGLGREVVLALHPACSERLTDSTGAGPARRPRAKRAAEKPMEPAKKTRRPAKAARAPRG
jgi:hypothetical protein